MFLTAALFACVLFLSSCGASDKEGTYEFFVLEQSYVDSDKSLEEIRALVTKDPYFTSKITYSGKYSQAGTQAIQEFLEHVDGLDTGYICSRMKSPMEHFTLSLWSKDPANRLVSRIYTADKWHNAPDNGWSIHQ